MKKKVVRSSGRPMNAVLLHPFDRTPPPAAVGLDRVYALFADYPVHWGWCPECFGPDWEARMRAFHSHVRTAPLDSFAMIYFEHPHCSGGESTFLHWVPRGLEIGFFDGQIDDFCGQMLKLGLLSWPEGQLLALRQLFCRVALNWFIDGTVEPLQMAQTEERKKSDADAIGLSLVEMLCALRIEMASIIAWLFDIDTPAAWRTIAALMETDQIMDDPSYYVLADSNREDVFHAAQAALERRARSDFYSLVTHAALIAAWERFFERDPGLADVLSSAESMLASYRFQQSEPERRVDEELIRRLFAVV